MKNEKGFSLIEALIGVAVFGLISVGILSSLAVSARSNITNSNQTQAESLARTQLEYIKSQNYDSSTNNPPSYQAISTPPGYSFVTPMVVRHSQPDDGLQIITVSVKYNGNTLFTIVGYKVNR